MRIYSIDSEPLCANMTIKVVLLQAHAVTNPVNIKLEVHKALSICLALCNRHLSHFDEILKIKVLNCSTGTRT